MVRSSAWILTAIVVVVAGCATVQVGRDFDPAVFRAFEPGKTTTAEVLQVAGEPYMRQVLPDGTEMWTWISSTSSATIIPLPFYSEVHTDGTTKTVSLIFRDGVLTRPATAPVPPPRP